MSKREKEIQKSEEKLKQLDKALKLEEEKNWKSQLSSSRSKDSKIKDMKRAPFDQKTKGSMMEYNDDASKGSLLMTRTKKHCLEISKENDIFNSDEENKNQEISDNENELGFRVTADSMWKQKEYLNSNSAGWHNGLTEDHETKDECFQNVKCTEVRTSGKSKEILRAKSSDLQIIEDVSESKELSQRGFESFSKNKTITSHKNLHKDVSPKSNGLYQENLGKSMTRNEHNTSGILKSWSENISNIMEATFKDEDDKNTEEQPYHDNSSNNQAYYFSTCKPRYGINPFHKTTFIDEQLR